MKKLFILMILVFPLVSCMAVEGIGCLTQIPVQIPRIQTYPEDGAENVPPNGVVVVEHGGRMSNFGMSAVDVNDPGWKYGSGGGVDGRQYLYVSSESHEADERFSIRESLSGIAYKPFEDVAELRTPEGFSENGEVIITVEVGCYEPYEFRFTTGSLDDE